MFLKLSLFNDIISTKLYAKLDDFNFNIDIVIVPYLDGDFSCASSCDVYIAQLFRLVRAANQIINLHNWINS